MLAMTQVRSFTELADDRAHMTFHRLVRQHHQQSPCCSSPGKELLDFRLSFRGHSGSDSPQPSSGPLWGSSSPFPMATRDLRKSPSTPLPMELTKRCRRIGIKHPHHLLVLPMEEQQDPSVGQTCFTLLARDPVALLQLLGHIRRSGCFSLQTARASRSVLNAHQALRNRATRLNAPGSRSPIADCRLACLLLPHGALPDRLGLWVEFTLGKAYPCC